MPTIIPIRDLKDTAKVSDLCHASKEPIFVTKNGYGDMVIMSTEVYERIRLNSVYERLMEAEEDIAAGRIMDAESSIRKLRAEYDL